MRRAGCDSGHIAFPLLSHKSTIEEVGTLGGAVCQ